MSAAAEVCSGWYDVEWRWLGDTECGHEGEAYEGDQIGWRHCNECVGFSDGDERDWKEEGDEWETGLSNSFTF